MSRKICKSCGEINGSSAMYCGICNASLRDVKVEMEVSTPVQKYGSNHGTRSTYYSSSDDVSVGSWLMIMILLAIPFINIIAIFFIAFASPNDSIKNFGKASLILTFVGIIFLFLLKGCS